MSTRIAGGPIRRHLVGGGIKPLIVGSLRDRVGITDQIRKLIKASDASNILIVTIDEYKVRRTTVFEVIE